MRDMLTRRRHTGAANVRPSRWAQRDILPVHFLLMPSRSRQGTCGPIGRRRPLSTPRAAQS